MTFLIDTHTFIWAISDVKKLSDHALKIIKDKENDVFVSTVSFWEIALKTSIKKFFFEGIVVDDLPEYAQETGFQILDIKAREACSFAKLPLKDNHKDPFDRMIICQAITKDMTLISKDKMFAQYQNDGLRLVW